jgi:aminopeptidase N
VVIHEIAHHWFGNSVTETTWDDAWLSEGFTTFFTLLFIENEYGKEEYKKGIEKAKKTIFDLVKKMPGFSIVSPRTAEKESVTSGITYQKGAWVLHMLRNLIGEAAFKKGIQDYYAKFYTSSATTDDFRKVMEKVSGMDLEVFFRQWLYHPEIPRLQVAWKYDRVQKKITISMDQIQNGDLIFDLPVEIAIYKKGSSAPTFLKIHLDKKHKTQTFKLNDAPEKLEIDPKNVLLCESSMMEMK